MSRQDMHQPGAEVGLSPINFQSHGREFLDAALREFEHADPGFSFVGYFLAGRAIELALKSFLLLRGKSEADLKRISHDLALGLREADEAGMGNTVNLAPEHIAALTWANEYYARKELEYIRSTGFNSFPDRGPLLSCAEAVLDGIEPELRNWQPPQRTRTPEES